MAYITFKITSPTSSKPDAGKKRQLSQGGATVNRNGVLSALLPAGNMA